MDSEDEGTVGQWNDGNRAFVQAFMARGSMTLKQAKPILAAIFSAERGGEFIDPADVTLADFRSYLAAASSVLSPFDYEIRSTEHQVSKDRIYAFVNSTSDPLTQLATIRTPDELSYIKRLLDAMFEKYNSPRAEVMGVTSMQALKEARAPRQDRQIVADGGDTQAAVDKGLTNTQAERLLASIVAEGWFERSKEGWYTLSARALLELRSWLIATYNDPDLEDGEWQRIKNCEACKNIITIGQRCSELDCNIRLHDICHSAYWKTRREKKCPRCETEWDGRRWVGEKAITTTEAYLTGRRRSGGAARRSETLDNEEDTDEDEAEE